MPDLDYIASLGNTPAVPAPQGNAFVAGLKSGGYGLASSIAGVVGAGAQLAGFGNDNRFSQAAKDFADQAASQRPDLDQAGWTGGGLPGVAYQAGKLIPQFAGLAAGTALAAPLVPEALGAGVLGRLGMAAPEFLGGAGGEAGAARLAATGLAPDAVAAQQAATGAKAATNFVAGAAPMAATSVGDIYNDANQKPGGASYGDAAKAALLGVPVGMVQAIGPHGASGIINSGLAHAGAFAIGSGLQEAAVSTNQDMTAGDRASAILEAAAGGAVFGGLFGAVPAAGKALIAGKGFFSPKVSTDQLSDSVKAVVEPDQTPPTAPGSQPVPQVDTDASQPGSSSVPSEPAISPQAAGAVPDSAPQGDVDLASLTARLQAGGGKDAPPELKEAARKLLNPAPIEAQEAQLSPEQQAQLQPQTKWDSLQALRDSYAQKGDTAGVARIDAVLKTSTPEDVEQMRDPVAAATGDDSSAGKAEATLGAQEDAAVRQRDATVLKTLTGGDVAAPGATSEDTARKAMFSTLGGDDVKAPLMRDFMDNAKSTEPIGLFNEMKQAIDDKDPVSRTSAFRNMATQLGFGNDGGKFGPVDLDKAMATAQATADPQERAIAVDRVKDMQAIRDAAGQQAETPQTNILGPTDASDSLQKDVAGPPVQVAGLVLPHPDTLPRAPEGATPEALVSRAPQPAAAETSTSAAPAAPAEQAAPAEPKSIVDRIVDYARSWMQDNGKTSIPVNTLQAGFGDLNKTDFQAALRNIHGDDTGNALIPAPKGEPRTEDGKPFGITIPGSPGRLHHLSLEDLNDAVQERGAAGADQANGPGAVPQDGSGDEPARQTAGAQPDQGGAQVGAASGPAQAETPLEAHQRFMREQDDYAAQAIREMQNPETGATELPAQTVGASDAEAAQALSRPPETIPPAAPPPISAKVTYDRSVDDFDKKSEAYNVMRNELVDNATPKAADRFDKVLTAIDKNDSANMPASSIYALVKNHVTQNDIKAISKLRGSDMTNAIADVFDRTPGASLDGYLKDYDHAQELQRQSNLSMAQTMADIRKALSPDPTPHDAVVDQLRAKSVADAQQTITEMQAKYPTGGTNYAAPARADFSKQQYDTFKDLLPNNQHSSFAQIFDALKHGSNAHEPADAFAMSRLGVGHRDAVSALRIMERSPEDGATFMKALEAKYGFSPEDIGRAQEQGRTLQATSDMSLGERIQRVAAGESHESVGLPNDRDLPVDPNAAPNAPKFSPKPGLDNIYQANSLSERQLAGIEEVPWGSFDPTANGGDRLGYPMYRGTNPLATPEVASRLRSMGFNPLVRFFSGGYRSVIGEERAGVHTGEQPIVAPGNLHPVTKNVERGLFRADTHHISNAYTELFGLLDHTAGFKHESGRRIAVEPQNLMPQVARADKALLVHWSQVNHGISDYSGSTMRDLIEHGRKQGADILILRGIGDESMPMDATKFPEKKRIGAFDKLAAHNREFGQTHTQYVILKPELLRNQNAAFDPTRLAENNVLAKLRTEPSITAVPPDHATVQRMVGDVLDKAELKGDVHNSVQVVPTTDALPQAVKDAARQAGFDFTKQTIPGLNYDGKTYIISENVAGPADVESLISHEVMHEATKRMATDSKGGYTNTLASYFDAAGGYDGFMALADKFPGVRQELEKYDFLKPNMTADDKAAAMNELYSQVAEKQNTFTSNQRANTTFMQWAKAGIASLMRKYGLGNFADRFLGYGAADVQKWLQDGRQLLQERQPPGTFDLASLPGLRADMVGLKRDGDGGQAALSAKLGGSIRDQGEALETVQRTMGALYAKARDNIVVGKVKGMNDAVQRNIMQSNDFERRWGKVIPAITKYFHASERGAVVTSNVRQAIGSVYRGMVRLGQNDPRLFEKFAGLVQDASANRLAPGKSWEEHTWLRNATNRDELQAKHAELQAEWNRWGQAIASAQRGLFRPTEKNLEPGALRNLYGMMQAKEQLGRNIAHINLLHAELRGLTDDVGKNPSQGFVNQRDLHSDVRGGATWARGQLDAMIAKADAFLQNNPDDARSRSLQTTLDTMKDELQDTDRGVPYTHFGRDGNHFNAFTFRSNDGNSAAHPEAVAKFQKWLNDNKMSDVSVNATNGNRNVMIRSSNEGSRKALAKALLPGGELHDILDSTVEPKDGLVDADDPSARPDLIPALMQVRDRLAKDIPPEALQSVLQSINGVMLDMAPVDSTLRMQRQRMNVQGMSKDLLKNMSQHDAIMLNAIGHGSVAMDKAEADATLVKQRHDMTASSHPLHGRVGELSGAIDGFRARNSAQSDRVQAGWVNVMRNAAHGFYLAASPGYLLMQVAQPYTLTMPELAKSHGIAASAQALGASLRDVAPLMKAMASVHRDILAGRGDNFSTGVTQEALRRYMAGAKDAAEGARRQDVAKYLTEIDKMGKLESGTLSYDNLTGSTSHAALGIAAKVYQTATATATYSELGGRLVAGLAAKRLYDANPDKVRGFDNREDYGAHVISKSMMEWGGAARSRLASAGGPLGAPAPLMFQFHAFGTQLYRIIMDETHNAIKGDTPEDRAEARKFLLAHTAAAMTLAGTLGLPFAGWAAAAITKGSTLGGGEGYDVDAHYRAFLASILGNKLGEVAAHGIPRFVGVDMSDLGDKDLLPAQSFLEDRRKMEESIPAYLANAWGSSFGAAAGAVIGIRDMGEGRMLQGMARFMPTALRNLVKAYSIDQHGYTNSSGEKMNIDAGALDVLKQALGVKSGDVAEEEEKSETVTGATEGRQYHSGIIKQQLARAIESGDESGAAHWQQEMAAYDSDPAHAGMPIGPSFRAYLAARQKAMAYSKATGLPLNAVIKDITTNAMVGGY